MERARALAGPIARGLCGLEAVCGVILMASMAAAADPDYIGLFKTRALPCLHPTVKADQATVELRNGPTTSGDTTTVRLQAFYPGLVKKNSLEADLLVRQSGSIRQLKVNVLTDTSAVHGSCDLTKNWKDF
jgi:hypothetical protein